MLRLLCDVKQYKWGQLGEESLVADLATCNTGQPANAAEPYAELWMGAHESGPARTAKSGTPLHQWLAHTPLALGPGVLSNYGNTLPFLFKVLSIRQALSIQAHPDKVLARQLHATWPDWYKDDNHKPELALAVRDFEALCGFCTLDEISSQVQAHPELRECIGDAPAQALAAAVSSSQAAQKAALKEAFSALMTSAEGKYQQASQRLFDRLHQCNANGLAEKDALFVRIFKQYPGDVGTLAVYFFNHIKLQPGEAIYLAANEPHAYLSGDLIEAMASSDNVIRAGLTPKHRDTDVLCKALTYKQGLPHKLCGDRVSRGISLYQPPFEEFQVLRVDVTQPGAISLPAQKSPMMLIVLESQGAHCLQVTSASVHHPDLESLTHVERGTVLFVPAGTSMQLHSLMQSPATACRLLAYAATANDNMFVSAREAARTMFRSVSDMPLAKLHAKHGVPSMPGMEDRFGSYDDLRMLRSM